MTSQGLGRFGRAWCQNDRLVIRIPRKESPLVLKRTEMGSKRAKTVLGGVFVYGEMG